MKNFLIAPSILSADFSRLGENVEQIISAGADIIHFDVMDNHYVPNITMGPMILQSLRNYGITVPIDVHLMTKPIDSLIPVFATSGASCIVFHPESSDHIDRSIQLIKKYGCKVGLVFNPATSLTYLEYVMDKINTIILMSVNPGFGGQSFLPSTINKIHQVRQLINHKKYNILLEVDGGIKIENISTIASAGADVFIIGSAIFGQSDYKLIIKIMKYKLSKIKNKIL